MWGFPPLSKCSLDTRLVVAHLMPLLHLGLPPKLLKRFKTFRGEGVAFGGSSDCFDGVVERCSAKILSSTICTPLSGVCR